MSIKASESLYNFIKTAEGYSAKPYKDFTGKATVGYGTSDGKIDKPVSEPEADQIMRQRVQLAESELSAKITRENLTEGQKDALIDMHYNLGGEALNANGFLDMVNAGRDSEVSQEILKYTKARSAKTGQMEDVPGLVNRVNQRSIWWNGVNAPNPNEAIATDEDTATLLDSMDEFDQSREEDEVEDPETLTPEDQDKIVQRSMEQFDAIGVIAPENIDDRIIQMNNARGVMTTEESNRTEQVKKLSKELGLSPLVVDADLEIYSEEEIRTRSKIPQIAKDFPVLAKWANRPENYVLMENTGDWTTSLTRSVQALSPKEKSDLEKTIRSSALEYPKSAIYTMMLYGALDVKEGSKVLKQIQDRQRELEVSDASREQLDRLDKVSQNLTPKFKNLFESVGDAWDAATDDDINSAILPELKDVYDGSATTFGGVLDYLGAMYENPTGTGLTATQAAVSSGLPIAVGIGGAAVGTPILGFAGAFSTSAVLSVGESIQKDLEEFRDPNTGEIDLQKAFSDPERVKRWRKRAAVYGAVMGASDAIYSRFIGRGFTKIIKQGGKGALVKGVAKEVATGAAEEGASQFTASVARDAVVGEADTDTLAEAGAEAVTEAIYGGIIGGSIGSITSVVKSGKQKYYKQKNTLEMSTKANEDMVNLHEAKVVHNSDEASTNNPAQVKDLIDSTVGIPPVPDSTSIYEDVDQVGDSEATSQEIEANTGTIQVAPSEIVSFFEDQNLNADDQMQTLPPEIYAEFVKNKTSDTSINIDVSDWMQVLEAYPEIDEIVRINGNDFNAREANEAIVDIQKDPFALYQDILDEDQSPGLLEESEVPPTPIADSVEAEAIQNETIVPSDPSEIISISDIKTKFRNEDDTKAYNTLRHRLTKGTKGIKRIDPDAVKIFTEIKYAQTKNRSNILGLEMSELVKSQTISQGKSNKIYGSFNSFFNNIFFGDKADPSTIVHEFGHSWIDEMSEDYVFMINLDPLTMNAAQKDYMYSMETAAKLLGLNNIGELNGMDRSSKEYIAAHETFAQTSEEYFLSGNFGNSRVRAAMEAFRKYMVAIIESIRRYAGKSGYSTLEITPEVNRMFDGIIGVDNQIDEVVTPMFADPMFDPATLGDKAAEYFITTRDALSESVGMFASKIMNANYNEREALIDSALNTAFDKATNIVDSMPEMVLAEQMKDQYDEYRKAVKSGQKNVSDPRISYTSLLAIFGGDETAMEVARQSIPKFAIAGKKKGGIDAAQLMYNLSLTDPRDLINILMVMGSRDELIGQNANRIVTEQFPILKSDQRIRNEAVVSLSNTKVTKFLQMEMKILAAKYLPTLKNLAEVFITSPQSMMKEESIENKSAELVTDSKAYKFSANSFRVDYGRLSRKAARFFRQGDFAAAFDAKVRSAIAYRANVKALEAQKMMARTTKRSKQFIKYSKSKDYAKKYNTEIMLFGRSFIESISSGNPDLPVLNIEMFPDGSGVTQNMVDGINKYVKDFSDRSRGRYGPHITVGSYIEMGEAIKFIQAQARLAKTVEVGNKKVLLEETVDNISNEISSSNSRSIEYSRQSFSHYKVAKDTMYTVFSSLYPSDIAFTSSTLGTILSDLEDGQADRNIQTRSDNDRVTAAFKKIASTSKGTNVEEILGPIVSRVPFAGSVWKYDKQSQPIVSSELGITFNNLAEYIMAELMMGSKSGAEKFLRGGTIANPVPIAGFVDGEIDITKWEALRTRLIAEGLLKKEHFQAMQDIWDLLREKQPEIKTAFRETDGYPIGNIEGWDVNTPWGVFKGGYVPISQDKQLTDQAHFESLIDPDTNNLSPSTLFPRQNTGMTNQRNDQYFPIDLDPNRLMMYISASNDIIHMRKPLLAIGKVFTDPSVREALEIKRPGAFKNMLVPWFERVKNQQHTERSADILNKWAPKLRKNLNRSIYLFRILTPLKQVFGLVPGLSSVKPQYLVASSLDVSMNPVASVNDVRGKSKVMRDRFEATVRRHISEWEDLSLNFDWVTQADKVVDSITYIGIQFMQNRVDTAIWLAAIRQADSQGGMTEAQKIHFADTAVQSTQSSSTVSYLNNFQTGSAISKFVQGIATSYIFAINNVVTKTAMRNPNKVKQARALIGLGLLYYIVPNLLDQGLEAAFKLPFEDDEEEDKTVSERLENIAKRAAVGSLSTIAPIVGSTAASYLYSGSTDFAPIFTKLSRETSMSLNGVTKNTQGVNMTPREMKAILMSITLFTGIPTSALAKDLFVEDVWIEGLNGETLDDRLRERKWQLRKLKWQEGRR